jgi:hypothetical protein
MAVSTSVRKSVVVPSLCCIVPGSRRVCCIIHGSLSWQGHTLLFCSAQLPSALKLSLLVLYTWRSQLFLSTTLLLLKFIATTATTTTIAASTETSSLATPTPILRLDRCPRAQAKSTCLNANWRSNLEPDSFVHGWQTRQANTICQSLDDPRSTTTIPLRL